MAKIFCFSATGNSLYTAKKIAAEINAQVLPMNGKVTTDDHVVGFVFPTYFWGLPVKVGKFLDRIEITDPNAYVFVVTTYGGFSRGIGRLVDKRLSKKGAGVSYSSKARMTENYLPAYNVNESEKLWDSADKKLEKIALEIKKGLTNKKERAILIDGLVYSFYPALRGNCADGFNVHGCKGCHVCEKVCPNGNIKLREGVPVFGKNCDMCLACINACPNDSIEYKNKTCGKKRFKSSRVTLAEIIKLNNSEE